MPSRFSNAAFGPTHLRPLLRARLEPGERLIGFAPAQLNPPQTPARFIAQVGLALIPGVGQIAAVAHGLLNQAQRRIVILTTRRLFLLTTDRNGPNTSGRGIAAELPLALLAVQCGPMPIPGGPAAPVPPARARLRRARRRRIRNAHLAAQVGIFTLIDLSSRGRIDLILPRATTGATARLREALLLLAQNPDSPAPYNPTAPTPKPPSPKPSHTPTRHVDILNG